MKKNSNFYLLLVNAILLAALLFTAAYKTAVNQAPAEIHFALVESELSRIEITSTEQKLELSHADSWYTQQGFAVSSGRLQLLLQRLNSITRGRVIEAGAAHYHRLMLDNPKDKLSEHSGVLIEFFPRDGGDAIALIVGKAIPHHKNEGGRYTAWYPDRRYLRILGAENSLWLIDDPLAEVSASAVDWIDPQLNLAANFISGTAHLRPVSSDAVQYLPLDNVGLNTLIGAQVVDFVEADNLVNSDVSDWPLTLNLDAQDGASWTIRIARGEADGDQDYLSRLSGGVLSNNGTSPRYRVRIETSASTQGTALWRDRELYIKSIALDSWFASKQALRFMLGNQQ